MKIALVSPYDWLTPGGVNRHIDQVANQFHERGHEVRILAPASDSVFDPRVITIGTPVSVPASGSRARIVLNPRLGRRVSQILESEQFDVVHVHEPLMPFLPIHVLRHSRRANPGVINVGTFHATKDGGNRLYWSWQRVLKRWFQELDGKITVSPPAERYVSRYFHGFYNVIPNGIDVQRWAAPDIEPIPGLDDGMLNILYVGRAEKRKGLGYLIRAFGMVNARMANTRLIVVGPASREKRRYRDAVERRGRRNIIFVDDVPDQDLPRFHRSAHVLCSPATGHESQGYVLLEAMAAGLPVVASNIDGYASVVTHEVEGLLTPRKDYIALADALTTLLRDGTLRDRMGRAGRERAEQYSWPRVTQRILSYYERLQESHTPARSQPGRATTAGLR